MDLFKKKIFKKKKNKVKVIKLFNTIKNKGIIKSIYFDKMKEKTHTCFTVKKELTNRITKWKEKKVVLITNTSQSHQALNKNTFSQHGSVFTNTNKDNFIHKQVMCCEENTFTNLDQKKVTITKKNINCDSLKHHFLNFKETSIIDFENDNIYDNLDESNTIKEDLISFVEEELID